MSSTSTSSHKTRAHVHGIHRSELCYDQKYHPMDQFTNPKRAAKMKSKYEDDLLVSDNTVTTFDNEANQLDCETDVDDGPEKKATSGKDSSYSSTKPFRCSSRQMKRNVLYDTNIHPQDVEIEELEEAEQAVYAPNKRVKTCVDGREVESDEENGETEQEIKDSDLMQLVEDVGSDHDDFQSSNSPPKSSVTPAGVNGHAQSFSAHHKESLSIVPQRTPGCHSTDDNDSWPTGKPFRIYEEALESQLRMEASAPPPLQYNDDDKENNVEDAALEDEPDPNARIWVRPAPLSLRNEQAVDLECEDSFHSYPFDNDFVSEVDSVLGALSPRPSFDGATVLDTDEVQGREIHESHQALEREAEGPTF